MSNYDDDEIPDLIFVSDDTNTKTTDHSEEFPPDLIPVTAANNSTITNPTPSADASPTTNPEIKPPVPLTILTGWLGSGKTTLLHNIVNSIATKSQTVAILQNETSAFMGVEKALTLTDEENEVFGEMLEIATGCVCCSVRSDFLLAIDTLLNKRHFDYVVLECSGIADVGNLINSLWADRALGSLAILDAVVCLVDAEQLLVQLFQGESSNLKTTQKTLNSALNILKNQLVYSDVAIINKADRCLFDALPIDLSGCGQNANTIQPLIPRRFLSNDYNNNSNNIVITNDETNTTSTTLDSTITTPPQQSPVTELSTILDHLNTIFSQIKQNHTKLTSLIKPLSKQLYTILSYMFKVNPTIEPMFAYRSNVSMANILNLQKYTLHSGNITDPLKQTAGSSTPASHHPSSHATQDKPQQSYKLRDGIVVWTENELLIPATYLHHSHHAHNDHSELCTDTSCNHDHDHDHNTVIEPQQCHDEHCTEDHDHHHSQPDHQQHDPHGISTVIITLEQPAEFIPIKSQLGQNRTPLLKAGSDSIDGNKGYKGYKAWGFDINLITANLDEYLFGHIQRADEEDCSAERRDFRERFHGGKESPDDIVEDLLAKQKKRILDERLEQIAKVNTDDLAKVKDEDDEIILEVPQMDSIEKEVIYRMKGVFSIQNRIPKWYLQSVFNTFDLLPTELLQTDEHSSLHNDIYSDWSIYDEWAGKQDVWQPEEKRYCSMIVIGVNIQVERLVDLFIKSLPQSYNQKE